VPEAPVFTATGAYRAGGGGDRQGERIGALFAAPAPEMSF
jgi:hypothetical protein